MAISTKVIGGVTYWYSQSTSVVKLDTAGKYLNYNIYIEPPALSGDAAAGNVLSGKTFYSNSYTKQTGSMTNQGAISATKNPTFSGATASYSYTIPAGYHNGSGTVSGSATMSNATTSTSGSASGSGTVTPGSVTVAANTTSVSGKTRVASTPTTNTSDISTYYIAVKPSVAAGSSTSISVSGTATTTVSAAGYISSDKSGTVSGSATVNSTAKDGSVYYLPLVTGGCTVAGGGLSKGTASGGGLSGGGLTAGNGEVSITQNPAVTPSVGGTGVSSTSQTTYGVTTTKPSGTDGTNYLTFDPGASVAQEGKAKGRGSVSRAAVTRAAFSQTVSRAAVTDAHTAGYIPAKDATTVISADSTTVSLAADSTTIGATSATSNYSSESSTSTTVNGGTNWYVPIVTASATGGTASASASIAKNPTASASASASQTGMTAGVSSTATSYYFTSSASASSASGYSTASASATGGSASVGKGITAGASASGTASGNKSATSTEVTASDSDSSTVYLKAATCTVAGGGLSKGTASGGGLSGGGLSGGGLSGAGDVGIDIYEVASGSQDANVTLSCVDIGSKDTTNYPYYFKVAAAGTTKTITRAQIDRAKIDRAAFSQTVSRAAVTDTHTAGYLPAQSATTVIAADSSTVSLAAGSIAADSISSTTASVTAAEKVEYVKMKSAGISRSGNTVSWNEGYTGSGSSTGATTSASRTGNTVSWGTGWITEGSSTGDTTSRSKGDGYLSPISGVTLSDYLTTTSTSGVGGFYGSGSVSTGAGWVVSGSTTSNASSTYYIKKGSISRSGNTVTWTTGWITGSSSTGTTTSRSAGSGSLVAISGVTLSDYLTTTASGNVGGFYGYGAVSTGEGWVTSGSTNSSNSSTYYIKKGSATTPTGSGASTSTSLSGTTLTVQRSVTPTVSAGWVSSGTAGTVTITGTVPTETRSVDPSNTQQTITPSSGKLFSSVTVNAMPSSYRNYVHLSNYYFNCSISSTGTTSATMYYRTLSGTITVQSKTYYIIGYYTCSNAFFDNGKPLTQNVAYQLCKGTTYYATTNSGSQTSAGYNIFGMWNGTRFYVLSNGSSLYPGGNNFEPKIYLIDATFTAGSSSRSSGLTRYKIMTNTRQINYQNAIFYSLPDSLPESTSTSVKCLYGYYYAYNQSGSSITEANTLVTFSGNTAQTMIEVRIYSSMDGTTFSTYYVPKNTTFGDWAMYEPKDPTGWTLVQDPYIMESTQTGKMGFQSGDYYQWCYYKNGSGPILSSATFTSSITEICRQS